MKAIIEVSTKVHLSRTKNRNFSHLIDAFNTHPNINWQALKNKSKSIVTIEFLDKISLYNGNKIIKLFK